MFDLCIWGLLCLHIGISMIVCSSGDNANNLVQSLLTCILANPLSILGGKTMDHLRCVPPRNKWLNLDYFIIFFF